MGISRDAIGGESQNSSQVSTSSKVAFENSVIAFSSPSLKSSNVE